MLFPKYVADLMNKYKDLCNEAEQLQAKIEEELTIYNAESGRDRELDHDVSTDWERLEQYAEQLRKNY